MRNKVTILTVLFLTHCTFAIGQSTPTEWLKKNTIEFSDFSFVDKAIKDKRFVFIGESSHGAAEFFSFKTNLSEYLIKKHGFEVVAVESPSVASYFYNYLPKTRLDTLSHSEHILFPVFCNQTTRTFIDSLDSWAIPIVGFDNQLGTTYQARNVTNFVYSKLVKIDSLAAREYLEINPLFSKDNLVRFSKQETWHSYPCINISDNLTCEYWLKKYNQFFNTLNSNLNQLLKVCNNDSLMATCIIRAVQTVQIDLISAIQKNQLYVRDSLMAENINYIINKIYPNKKVIFLAHNAHVSKNYNSVQGKFNGDHRTMMSFLKKSIIEKSLIIGLYGIEGETNNNNRVPRKMTCLEQDSTLEYQIKKLINHKAYIDLKNYPNKNTLNNVYLCHWGINPELINPQEQYDYLVFIKNLTPSTYIDK